MAVLTEEQTLLRDAAKAWASAKSPVAAFRKMRDAGTREGFDRATWKDMAEMGWAGVLIPEPYGGSDFGMTAMGLVLEETGRTLTASPLLSSAVAAASALLIGGSEAQKQAWLPKIASGEVIATLAVDEHAHHAPERVALDAVKSGDGYELSGRKAYVAEGAAADLLVVAARTGGKAGDTRGITLFLVEGKAKGLVRSALRTVDSRGAADLSFERVQIGADAVLGPVDGGFDILDAALDRARAAQAAEMLGTASQAFDITLEYLKTRTQFGQLIGSFQSLQHRAAKMFTDLELTRSCVEAALAAIDARANDVAALASLAKARAGDLLHLVSNEMVQMHGGIGMTDAHDAGLYLKRARVAEAAFGGSAFHRARYARLNGY